MTPEPLILEALVYFRYVGAEASAIRTYLGLREETRHTSGDDRQTLERLQAEGRVVRVGDRWLLAPELARAAKGPALRPEWRPEDGWLLLAAFHCEPPQRIELRVLLASADFIEHAVPTYAELYGGLNRLESGGLLRQRKGGLSLTPKALHLRESLGKCSGRGIRDQLDALRKLLHCPCCGIPLRAVRWRISLTQAEYDEAVSSYVVAARAGVSGKR
jgi:hypothetical protein